MCAAFTCTSYHFRDEGSFLLHLDYHIIIMCNASENNIYPLHFYTRIADTYIYIQWILRCRNTSKAQQTCPYIGGVPSSQGFNMGKIGVGNLRSVLTMKVSPN